MSRHPPQWKSLRNSTQPASPTVQPADFLLLFKRIVMTLNVNVTDLVLNYQFTLTSLAKMLLSVPLVVLSTLGILGFLGTNLLMTSMMSALSASLSGEQQKYITHLVWWGRDKTWLCRSGAWEDLIWDWFCTLRWDSKAGTEPATLVCSTLGFLGKGGSDHL